jgi:hypothetical protein
VNGPEQPGEEYLTEESHTTAAMLALIHQLMEADHAMALAGSLKNDEVSCSSQVQG